MAPQQQDGNTALQIEKLNAQMKDVVDTLYFLMVSAHGSGTGGTMKAQVRELIERLQSVLDTAPKLNVELPPELVQYVQGNRNPDIFTREFVESTMKLNQNLKGKTEAFGQFQDILAKTMIDHMDGVEGDVRTVVRNTGGNRLS